jgi:hypothetical protein|tara:strand:+ start:2732 stop:2938 length:207 start_codon:yes stop_codon:yes gene_type:complete
MMTDGFDLWHNGSKHCTFATLAEAVEEAEFLDGTVEIFGMGLGELLWTNLSDEPSDAGESPVAHGDVE